MFNPLVTEAFDDRNFIRSLSSHSINTNDEKFLQDFLLILKRMLQN